MASVHGRAFPYLSIPRTEMGCDPNTRQHELNDTAFVDTSSIDSMMRGLSQMMLNTPMVNISRGTAVNYFHSFDQIINQYDIDLVLVGDHIGCKSVAGMTGLLREKCRDRGLPLALIPYDLIDSRFASMSDVMARVDQFMETVLKAEPLMETVPDILPPARKG